MNQSPEIKDLAKALCAAQASLNAAKKDSLNPHFRSQYASLQSVWDAAREVLSPNGLSVSQLFEPTDGHLLSLTTMLIHTSGQWIAGTISVSLQKNDPQGSGSAATYCRRYGLSAILGIVADEDDDGNGASQRPQPSAQPAKTAVSAPVRATPAPRPTESYGTDKPISTAASIALDPAGAGWRTVIVPKFISKWAGATLGEMEEADLLYWAGAYKPKPYQGKIQQKDLDFRAALDAAQAELTADVSYDQSPNPF